MRRAVRSALSAVILLLVGCSDARAPSAERFCADFENVWSVGPRLEDLAGGDAQSVAGVSAQMSAAMEASLRHAPDEVYDDMVAVNERWQEVESELEAHSFNVDEMSPGALEELEENVGEMARRLEGPVTDWAATTC